MQVCRFIELECQAQTQPNERLIVRISVITITLNRCDFLRKAIDSVLAQNYEDIEHIVIDGGSTDGTVEMLRGYPHLKWISEPDDGQADAMNKGLRRASGDIFAWLNSDDTYPPNTFMTVADYFKTHESVAMIFGRCNLVNKQGESIGQTRMHEFQLRRVLLGFNNINTPATFVRLSAMRQLGEFDLNLRATYDVDMWIRVARQFKVQALNVMLSNLCLHDGSGLVGTRAHVKELPLLRERYWLHRTMVERLWWFPYYQMREWAFNAIKFRSLLRRI